MRELFSAAVPCQAGCQYCFAKWDKAYWELPRLENRKLSEKEAILCPCCDGEFFDQYKLAEDIKKVAEKMDKVYVSISTKRFIQEEEIHCIAQLNRELKAADKGFVKLAVSLSNRSMLEEMEPGTIAYDERLELAKKIRREGIFFALTIKPVLPFISAEEYCQIIDDFSKDTKYVLIGGLYINRESEFYSKYAKTIRQIQYRTVAWLPERPKWEYVEDDRQFQKIREYADKKGVFIFDSDEELIKSYIVREG